MSIGRNARAELQNANKVVLVVESAVLHKMLMEAEKVGGRGAEFLSQPECINIVIISKSLLNKENDRLVVFLFRVISKIRKAEIQNE